MPPAEHRYRIVNIVEHAVVETVDEILPSLPRACQCEDCRADVICMTLNAIPPRYVVHRWGEILSQAEFESPQKKAELVTAIVKSVHRVRGKPHDDKPRGTPG